MAIKVDLSNKNNIVNSNLFTVNKSIHPYQIEWKHNIIPVSETNENDNTIDTILKNINDYKENINESNAKQIFFSIYDKIPNNYYIELGITENQSDLIAKNSSLINDIDILNDEIESLKSLIRELRNENNELRKSITNDDPIPPEIPKLYRMSNKFGKNTKVSDNDLISSYTLNAGIPDTMVILKSSIIEREDSDTFTDLFEVAPGIYGFPQNPNEGDTVTKEVRYNGEKVIAEWTAFWYYTALYQNEPYKKLWKLTKFI
jgi:hypothetical protein